jgi:hypothetical protein
MNRNQIILLIDNALYELKSKVASSSVYKMDKKPISNYKEVLDLLRLEIQKNNKEINQRVLRATRDIGGSVVKEFEDTPLEEAIQSLTESLSKEIIGYRSLEPLRMDFGKGDPI